jgi:hypothetical protein
VHYNPAAASTLDGSRGPVAAGLDVEGLEAALRSALLKLQYIDSYLHPLPPGCSYELAAVTAGRGEMRATAWAEEQGGLAGLELGGAGEIVPIKSCHMENVIGLQLYAESR